MHKVEIIEIMNLRTNEVYSPWENKSESVINIIKRKDKRKWVQRNIPKRV